MHVVSIYIMSSKILLVAAGAVRNRTRRSLKAAIASKLIHYHLLCAQPGVVLFSLQTMYVDYVWQYIRGERSASRGLEESGGSCVEVHSCSGTHARGYPLPAYMAELEYIGD